MTMSLARPVIEVRYLRGPRDGESIDPRGSPDLLLTRVGDAVDRPSAGGDRRRLLATDAAIEAPRLLRRHGPGLMPHAPTTAANASKASKAATPIAIVHVAPDTLRPAPYNPRSMTEDARAKLRRGIEQFGIVDPIVARRADHLVVGGHQRLASASTLGLESVPVVYLDDITDDRAAALNVLLNNPGAQGAWDFAKLSDLLSELDGNGFDATLTGFDDEELAKLLSWTPDPENGLLAGVDPDAVPDAPKEPVTKPGDLITLGRHRLVCGDSTDTNAWDRLMGGKQADMVWTDPPYGVSYEAKNDALKAWDGRSNRPSHASQVENDTMSEEAIESLLSGSLGLAWAHCREGAAWYVAGPEGPRQMPFSRVLCALGVWRHTVNWIKDSFVLGRSDYHYRHEPLWYGWKEGAAHYFVNDRTQDSVWEIPRPKRSAEHPTMKPVALVQRAVENSSRPGEVVADPFGGSGTTLLACEVSGRTARLIELDPRYCDVIVTRWENATGQKAERPHG